jgi:hypothetical protein
VKCIGPTHKPQANLKVTLKVTHVTQPQSAQHTSFNMPALTCHAMQSHTYVYRHKHPVYACHPIGFFHNIGSPVSPALPACNHPTWTTGVRACATYRTDAWPSNGLRQNKQGSRDTLEPGKHFNTYTSPSPKTITRLAAHPTTQQPLKNTPGCGTQSSRPLLCAPAPNSAVHETG